MKDKKPAEELYDIRKDPSEVHNLADNPEYSATLKEFRNRLTKWRSNVGDTGVTADFRSGGWPGIYPTRPLAEWLSIRIHVGKSHPAQRPQTRDRPSAPVLPGDEIPQGRENATLKDRVQRSPNPSAKCKPTPFCEIFLP